MGLELYCHPSRPFSATLLAEAPLFSPPPKPYPVEPAERHIYGEGKEVADHLLKGSHQLLLAVGAGLRGLEAQQDPHSDAKHEALHLGVHQQAGPGGTQPPHQAGTHLLLDDGHVVLQGFPGEGLHDHLPGGTRRKRKGTQAQPLRPGRPRPLPVRHRGRTFLRCLCCPLWRLERQPEPRMVRTDEGHCTDTSRCSPSKICRTFSAPITRTVGRPNR